MRRILISSPIVLFLVVSSLQAEVIKGAIKKVDADKGTLTVRVKGKDREFRVTAETRITIQVAAGVVEPMDGLNNPWFKRAEQAAEGKGYGVDITVEKKDDKEVVTEVHLFTPTRRDDAAPDGIAASTVGQVQPEFPQARNAIKGHSDFLPHKKWTALPGKVIGILIADNEVCGFSGGAVGEDGYSFAVHGSTYRSVYVPDQPGKALIGEISVPVGNKGRTMGFKNLSLATPRMLKPAGVTGKFQLVEVEVNDGLGSPAPGESDQGFVATKIKVLDGTRDFPLKFATLIPELRKQYQDHLKNQANQVDAILRKAQVKAVEDRKPTGPVEKSTFMFLSWLPAKERLVVRFQTQVRDGVYRDFGDSQGPLGKRGPTFGVETGSEFEVSKTGKVERIQHLPLQPFWKADAFPQGHLIIETKDKLVIEAPKKK